MMASPEVMLKETRSQATDAETAGIRDRDHLIMYVVFSINVIKPEHLDAFLRNVRVHARKSNEEPGCIRYEVLQDTSDSRTVCLSEVFADEAAFSAHLAAPHYAEWMEMSRDWRLREERVRHVLDFVYTPLED